MRKDKTKNSVLFPSTLTVRDGQTIVLQTPCTLQYRRTETSINTNTGARQYVTHYDCLIPYTNLNLVASFGYDVDGVTPYLWAGYDKRNVGMIQGYKVGCKLQLYKLL